MPSSQPTVAVVGGGLAGLAAACALSQSGRRVTMFERRPFLGGRAASYEHPGTGEVVDNCQHVLFGCCSNLIAFYRTIGVEDRIRWFDRMTFIEPGGRQSVLEPSPLPAPLHIMPSLMGFKVLSLRDKLAIARGATALIRSGHKEEGNFQQWLERHRQTSAAIERFWKPILVSALSEDLDRIAVPYAAQVVRESMKSADARRMGVPTVPLTELYNAARDYIFQHGGSVRFRTSVQAIVPEDSGVRVRVADSEELFDYAVLAVPFDSAARLLPETAEAAALRYQISHFETSPITGVHLWFDRQISSLPHAVLLDRTIQWMFHKSQLQVPVAGSVGPGGECGDRRVEIPSYVELVISASKSLINKSRQEIIDLALTELREFFPLARDARLLKATVIKELNATFSPIPGIEAHRPPQHTAWPRVFLAGDWTATGWPATMEGAVRSGYLAAEELTKQKLLVADLPSGALLSLLLRR
jgi:squalene-associated FAD-dependent desaturase